MYKSKKIAVVIPTYKAKDTISKVILDIRSLGDLVDLIYVVDDKCPDESWKNASKDEGVHVIRHETNLGVGGAVKSGYLAGLRDGADIIIKMDADGQMDANFIPGLLSPIIQGEGTCGFCGYAKGNRFKDKTALKAMPRMRLLGNRSLSYIVRILSGHLDLDDVSNGYTAITKQCLTTLDLEKIDNRYYFEIDMIFNLALIHQHICNVGMPAKYDNEISSLSITDTLIKFPAKILKSYLGKIKNDVLGR